MCTLNLSNGTYQLYLTKDKLKEKKKAEEIYAEAFMGEMSRGLGFALKFFRGTWLVKSVKHATLDLRAVSSSPELGVELT